MVVKMSNIKQYKKGTKNQITKNFSSTEFDCSCKREDCKVTLIDIDHVNLLQKVRDELKAPIHINSAFRCKEHNKEVGGASQSRHTVSDATDIIIQGMTPDQVADYFDKLGVNGLGRYTTFTHIDSRPLGSKAKARWDFRKDNKAR